MNKTTRGAGLAVSLALSMAASSGRAFDAQKAQDVVRDLSASTGHAADAAPPAAAARPVAQAGLLAQPSFNTLVFEYDIETTLDEIWELYTFTSLRYLLPSDWANPTLKPHTIVCPGGAKSYAADQLWPELKPGLQIQGVLHWGVTNILQDMDVVGLDRPRRIAFNYGTRAPSEGSQTIELHAATLASGRPGVRVVHSSTYRGKNWLYHSFYGYVHRTLLDSWHLGSKHYLEARAWARGYCGTPSPEARQNARYQALSARARKSGTFTTPRFEQALCLFSQRRLGLTEGLPTDEAKLADFTGSLAAALTADENSALQRFSQAQQASLDRARAASEACAP